MQNQVKFIATIFFFALSLFPSTLFSQTDLKSVPALVETAKRNGTAFKNQTNLFTENKDYSKREINEAVNAASVLKINFSELSELLSSKPQAIEMSFPFKNSMITVELVQKKCFE